MQTPKFSFFFIAVILFSCGKFPDLGEGYKLDYDGNGDILLTDKKNTILVPGHILGISYDSVFILVKQKPRDSIRACRYLKNETLRDCDRAFRDSKIEVYWIINKKDKNISGPFNWLQFVNRKNSLGIPLSIEFDDII